MNEIQQVRTPDSIGVEIRALTEQARIITLWYGIEIGRRLTEAKELVGHGEWLLFLENQTGFSQPTASRFMRLYKEYGAEQTSLFGAESKYSALNNLSVSKALSLLAIPEDEREEFAEEHDVENMTTRELEQAIKDKLAAEDKATAAEARALEMRSRAEQAEQKQTEMAAELKELRNRPVEVAVQRDEKAIKDAVAAAKKEAKDKIQKLTEERDAAIANAEQLKTKADAAVGAEERIAAAEAERARIERELEKAQKQLKAADADVTAFGVHFEALQRELNATIAALDKIRGKSPETAEKLRAAVNQVLERVGR